MSTVEANIAGRTVRLTNLDKVLWPAAGFTKAHLIDYYVGVADVLLPHIAERPITLGRWPSGVDGPGFAQIECRGAPDWLPTRSLQLRNGEVRSFCLIGDLPALVWAANLGTLEFHTYLGGGPDAEDATVALFDLDPRPGAGVLAAARLALALRGVLDAWQLAACVKSSGGDGLHVVVPLNTRHDFARIRSFCEEVAAQLDTRAVNVDCAQNHADAGARGRAGRRLRPGAAARAATSGYGGDAVNTFVRSAVSTPPVSAGIPAAEP
jgi:bifunctional non-homologous end joining protein LigD